MEVAKYMTRNSGTIRMCGTVLSRVRELQANLTIVTEIRTDRGSDTDSIDIPSSVPSHVLLEFLQTLETTAAGAMDLANDTQTLMRLLVARRIETALGVAHLHQDPTKQLKEDFMSPKTLRLIEEATKMREDLTWAMEAQKSVTNNRTIFLGTASRMPLEAISVIVPQIKTNAVRVGALEAKELARAKARATPRFGGKSPRQMSVRTPLTTKG